MEQFTDDDELGWLLARAPNVQQQGPQPQHDFTSSTDALIRRRAAETPAPTFLSSLLGIDAEGWDVSAWILHAIYETDALPAGLTYDDVDRIERSTKTGRYSAEGKSETEWQIEEVVNDLLAGGTLTSVSYDGWPGTGWARLPWTELWRRLSVDPALFEQPYPCFTWFPYRSWPVNLAPPREGSLDREQFERLMVHLEAHSSHGGDTPCLASYAACAVGEFDHDVLYRGVLRDIRSLFEREELSGSPSNFWPADRSWFVYTDWDLWGTKVSGAAPLVERLENDPELEVIRLPFSSASP